MFTIDPSSLLLLYGILVLVVITKGSSTCEFSYPPLPCREWILLNRVRGQDVQLMKKLDISLICDLMVEKKKLKYGLL